MGNDLGRLLHARDITARWRAESENASARLELSQYRERMAYLLSQHEPVASLGLDRERLRLALAFVLHGDAKRLVRDLEELECFEVANG